MFLYARIVLEKPSFWLFAGLALLSLGLAYISWRYVERPFRDRQLFSRSRIFRFAALGAVPLAVVGCIGLNGLPSRFGEDVDLLVTNRVRSQYVAKRRDQLKGIERFSSEKKLRVLLLGDSFAGDFLNMMAEAGLLPDAEIRVRYIPVRCQIYCGEENGLDFVAEIYRDECAKGVYKEDFYPSLQPMIQDANVIIFASLWAEWAARRLPETIKNLQIPDSTRIIVVGRKHFGKIGPRNYLGLSLQEKAALRNRVDNQHAYINGILRTGMEIMRNVDFVDLPELVCGADSETCPVFSPEGKLLSYDGNHLTQAGAAYIGGLLKEHPAFKALEGGQSD
ncbi:MAG: hypothetical protein LBI31_04335 [Zoogloeaceae bacterium]|nr:hypothetical protein [Zoogloeaceae bacterium]